MTNSKDKGDRAEREIAKMLSDNLGLTVKRKLGAGRAEDTGDLYGIPDTVGQVAFWGDALRAMREKPVACELQQANEGATFGVSFIRTQRGIWRAVMTINQWSTYQREVMS